ncbi:MAG: phosphoglycerate dehydrogenase [Candidatus Melainabacteria bacterium]
MTHTELTASTQKPVVLVTDNIHPSAVDILSGSCEVIYEKKLSAEELKSAIVRADALMIRSASQVTAEILDAAPRLRIVGRAGVGTDNVDLAAATQHGVVVVNSPAGNTIAAAEHTIGMLFALARHIPQGDSSLKNSAWERSKLVGVELFGKTLGVIGLGRIGQHVAKACLTLGMKVLVADPFLTQAKAEELGVQLVELPAIWEQADFITIHAPKTKETTNLINQKTLAQCKPGVRFINCARGGIIHEADLAAAIENGHVAGAAIDVFEQEPVNADNPLLKLGNRVVLTPHLGASTEEAQINVALDVAEQIRDFFTTGTARAAVNMPSLRKEIMDPVKHYMPMAEALGSMGRQIAQGALQSVEILAKGTLHGVKVEPLTIAVLKGILSRNMEGVNYVNAQSIADERGVQVQESSVKTSRSFQNLLQITLVTDKGTTMVAGTLISDRIYRIVNVDGYPMNLQPTSRVLFTPHHDKPGMIARVATVLAANEVNISALQVARKEESTDEAGGESLMVFNLDNDVSDAVMAEIEAVEGIFGARLIKL